MSLQKLVGGAAVAAALSGFALIAPSQAAMYPMAHYATAHIQHVDCAAGFHLGPIGTCIIGTDDNPPPVVERRSADEGCQTKTVKRTDSDGNSETRSKTNCD